MRPPFLISLSFWRTPPLRANDRRSWPAQHRAFQQALTEARWSIRAAHVPCVERAHVTLHYRPSTKRRQDADGIAPTCKVALDALVAEGVLSDDSSAFVPITSQHIHPPDSNGAALWLEIAELPAQTGDDAA